MFHAKFTKYGFKSALFILTFILGLSGVIFADIICTQQIRNIELVGNNYIKNATIPSYNVEVPLLIEVEDIFCPPEVFVSLSIENATLENIPLWRSCSNVSIIDGNMTSDPFFILSKNNKTFLIYNQNYEEPEENRSFHLVFDDKTENTAGHSHIYFGQNNYADVAQCYIHRNIPLAQNKGLLAQSCYPLVIFSGEGVPATIKSSSLFYPSKNRYNLYLSHEYYSDQIEGYCPFVIRMPNRNVSIDVINNDGGVYKKFDGISLPKDTDRDLFYLGSDWHIREIILNEGDKKIIISKPENYGVSFGLDENGLFNLHICTNNTGETYLLDGINVNFLDNYSQQQTEDMLCYYLDASRITYGEVRNLTNQDIENQKIELIGQVYTRDDGYAIGIKGTITISNSSNDFFKTIIVTDGDNKPGKMSYNVSYDFMNKMYVYENELLLKGDGHLFPFDTYSDTYEVMPPELKRTEQEPIKLADGTEIVAFFNEGKVRVEKRIEMDRLIGFLLAYLMFIIGLFLVFDYIKHTGNLTSKSKLGIITIFLSIIINIDTLLQHPISILTAIYALTIVVSYLILGIKK
ncbi:hypothetical protein H0O01_05080 [Candidatus Micrarchaeota archaeon]|nr:hypothetical protein [Candidatus Micrarchaeota archaeon]